MLADRKWSEMQRCARELDQLVEYCAEQEYDLQKPIPDEISARVSRLVARLNELQKLR